jgi:hypothetical protein
MRTYSPFFQTLYDQTAPVGSLGRGTHYSVLRATVFHDRHGRRSLGANFLDFAVIWDEDHDERVMLPIERLYRSGNLASFIMFGERKGGFSGVISPKLQPPQYATSLVSAQETLQKSSETVDNDYWTAEVVYMNAPGGLISAAESDVMLYLSTINMLWALGPKDIVEPKQPEPDI